MCTYKAMNTDHFGIPKTDLEESLLTLVNLFSSVNLCARIFQYCSWWQDRITS